MPGDDSCLRRLLPPQRGYFGGFVGFFAPAQNFGSEDRMIEALQMQIVERLAFDPWLDHAVDAPAHPDLAGLGLVARPRGEVGDAADRGVFEPLLKADLAQGRISKRDAEAEAQTMPAVA